MDTTKYKFHKLTPVRNTELTVYSDALDYVFRDDDLKNIAITGPYSSGKSSVLESYKAANINKKFIHISLAHFETASSLSFESSDDEIEDLPSDKTIATKVSIPDSEIEGKILNQLIHQVDPKDIPQTHFKVKRQFPQKTVFSIAAITTMFLLLLIFLFNRSSWAAFVNAITLNWLQIALSQTATDWFVVAAIVGLIFLFALFGLLKLQHNRNLFRKLSIQGNEFEIFANSEDSFFNKHLNEVLYLFKNANSDAIVFEDMDRYNSNQIFEKLREINYLLNNSYDQNEKLTLSAKVIQKIKGYFIKQEQDNKKKIFRFFYLLRDDIFISKDRTKFFDFIIPVVPVIDGANSYDKFIEYFRDGGILEYFNGSFLQEISMYVDDMRLLKNIYNEYRVYHDRIQGTELSRDKLLGMIIYKNLFPRDFSELQLGKGFVFCLFKNKENFIKDEIDKINQRIVDINALLDKAAQEQIRDIDELDAIFLDESQKIYNVDGKESNAFSNRGEFIRAMKENPNRVYASSSYYGRNNGHQPIKIMHEFEKLLLVPEYIERKKAIEAKTSTNKKHLYDELCQLDTCKKELESATLSEIVGLSKSMSSTVFASTHINEIGVPYKYEDVKGSLYFPLIKYLIRNKHIDENYPDYMSYFYEQRISRVDQIFIRSVFDVEGKPFTYALKNSALVASKISSRYYSQPEVLNFDLFAFLLRTQNENLSQVIRQLRDNHRLDFVLEFWQANREIQLFIHDINKDWPALWSRILQVDAISSELVNKYLIDTFYYSSNHEIEKINADDIITEHISSCANFLNITEPQIKLIADALELLKVSFHEIDYDSSHIGLFSEIYSRNLYEINQPMVFMILQKVYHLPESDDFYHRNYTLVITKLDEPLAKYIIKEIDTYVRFVIGICDGKITDDEASAISALNHDALAKELKNKYISVLATKIENLQAIDDLTLWPSLLSYHCVPCSKANVLNYYFASGNAFDDTLTEFINTSKLETGLSYNDILEKYGEEHASDFYKSVITNSALTNENYRDLLSKFGRIYTQFSFADIAIDKVRILIELKIIKMNLHNLQFVRKNYGTCVMYFILSNIDDYAQKTIDDSEGSFDIAELKHLLEEKIPDNNLLRLLNFTQEPISITGSSVSDAVKKRIIDNNYYKEDLPFLVSGFDEASAEIKSVLQKLCINRMSDILTNKINIPYGLLDALLRSSNCSYKIDLLAIQLEGLTREQAVECFSILQLTTLLSVFDGKWPLIEIDAANTAILKVMRAKEWISSFIEDKDDPKFYRVRAKRSADSNDKLPDHLL